MWTVYGNVLIVNGPAVIPHRADNYQTWPHLNRHSLFQLNASKLKRLWILRTLLMRRTVFTVFVLAALAVSSANGSSVSKAKTHKYANAAPTTRSVQNKAGRPTPEEVGRAAGLKIRSDLARHRAAQAVPHSRQRVASSQSHSQSGRSSHQALIAKAPSRTPQLSTALEHAKSQVPARSPEPPGSQARSSRRIEAASLHPSPFAPKTEQPTSETGSFAETSSFAGTRRTSEASTTAKTKPTPEIDIPAQDSDSADSDVSAADAPTAYAQSADTPAAGVPSSDERILTRRAAIQPISLRTSRLGMPPPLVGSRANLEHQNAMSDAEGLERIEDEDDLADRIAKKLLVPVPTSIALTVNGNLPVNHRYCRPWTALFLSDLARSHAAEFHSPLEVSSAVRTVAYQKRLMGINGNAAAAEGDIVSPHLTGATIDIAKGPLSRQEIAWMRTRLLTLEQAGKIDVEEEFQQACFHITVYKNYAPPSRRTPPARTTPARPAHRKSVQPEIALADTAQPDATQPDAARPGSAPAAHAHRRHTHRRTVARTTDPSSGIASRGL